jgi:hypothetical protein
MATFIVKSLICLAVVATLWGPMEAWLGSHQRAGLACTSDFNACRMAGKVIPLVDRSSVPGRNSETASAALDSARGAALPKE